MSKPNVVVNHRGVMVITTAQLHSTKTGNEAKRLSLGNHAAKTIHLHHQKQQALDADSKAIQQINFVGKLD